MSADHKQIDYGRYFQGVISILAIIAVLVMTTSMERAYAHGADNHAAEEAQVGAPGPDSAALDAHQAHDHTTASDDQKHEEAQPTDEHHPDDAPAPHHIDQAKAPSGHDHSAHEGWATNGFERFLAWIGKFHPALTNFPIALLIAAALAELLLMCRGNDDDRLRHAARYCAALGAFTALLTAGFGWFYSGFDFAGDDTVLAAHRWNGTAIGILAVGLGILAIAEQERSSPRWRNGFRAVLFVLAIMVSVNGYLGGRMLYGADHYAWPAHQHDDAHEHMDH